MYPTSIKKIPTKPYNVFRNMHQRCYNPKHINYNMYGAKGVYVASEWHDFQVFAKWYHTQCKLLKVDPYNNTHQIDKDKRCEFIYPAFYSSMSCELLPRAANSELAAAKHYTLTSPTGIITQIYNMEKFCKAQNLNSGAMGRVFHGKSKQHKGWTK